MKKHSQQREGLRKGIYLLPNLFTTANLFCGFFSVIKSLNGDFIAASWAILLAGIFDTLDGRVARLTKAESEFGIEYDSLVDLASFGLAPGILVYTWGLQNVGRFGWLAPFLFFACGALRLARFNVQHDNVENSFFQGLPIPTAAYVLASFTLFHHHFFSLSVPAPLFLSLVTILLSCLMVSTINYRSMKSLEIKGKHSFFALVLVVLSIFVIATEPEITIFVLVLAYVSSGLLEEIFTQKESRKLVAKVKKHREDKRAQLKMKLVSGGDVVHFKQEEKSEKNPK